MSALIELAAEIGIDVEYDDWQGGRRRVADESVVAVLAALDIDAATPEAAEHALAARRAAALRPGLPACRVLRKDRVEPITVRLPAARSATAWIDTEDGERLDLELPPAEDSHQIDGDTVGLHRLTVPEDLAEGYHVLRLRDGDDEWSMSLIMTPGPLTVAAARRQWGFAVQLYSVRSAQSWGIGDFADLGRLGEWSAGHGAGYLLINPIHAAQPRPPLENSPYLPTSRRFRNPIYLRPEQIPEYEVLDPAARRIVDAARARAAAADNQDREVRIDRNAVWEAKREACRLIFAEPRSPEREQAFAAFRAQEGVELDQYATWAAIGEQYGADWYRWPAGLQDPGSPAVAAYADDHRGQIDYHRWLQWVVDEQLGAAQDHCRAAGMELGLMPDLAVGVHPGGSDTWGWRHVYADGINVGAPPDAYNQNGQDWGQRPWRPDRLAESGYRPFITLVRAVLRHAGAVRIDHIIGLFRLWWVPLGQGPGAGTYVRYDHEAMIGILALEARRAGAVVVGEDLGTVEPSARRYLTERGILGTSILWFENDGDGRPLPPGRWRDQSLASVTTHDLPPTAAFLAGDHVRLRARLGLLTRPYPEELAADQEARAGWLAALVAEGALDEADGRLADDRGEGVDRSLVWRQLLALHRYLRLSPARLINIALTDAVADPSPQNLPGTVDEYPNWRVPLHDAYGRPITLEQLIADPRVAEVIAAAMPSPSLPSPSLPSPACRAQPCRRVSKSLVRAACRGVGDPSAAGPEGHRAGYGCPAAYSGAVRPNRRTSTWRPAKNSWSRRTPSRRKPSRSCSATEAEL